MSPEDIVLMLRNYADEIAQHEITEWEDGFHRGLLKAARLIEEHQ